MADDPDPREERGNSIPFIPESTWSRAVRPVPRRPAWRIIPTGEETVHVVPNGDTVAHELDEDCVCGVTSRISEHHEECDHPDIWIHQHHALDGRTTPVVS